MAQLQASRPVLCRLRFHRPEVKWKVAADSPCRQIQHCRACGQELDSSIWHNWGEPQGIGESPHPCGARVTCLDCGDQKVVMAHDTVSYSGDKLPRPRSSNEDFERTSCYTVDLCTRCDYVWSDRPHHDIGRGDRCTRCGYLDPGDGEA